MVRNKAAGQQQYWMVVNADPHAPVALPSVPRVVPRAALDVSEEAMIPVALPKHGIPCLMFTVVTPTTIIKLLSDWQPSLFFLLSSFSGP